MEAELDASTFLRLALLLPAYKGAALARLEQMVHESGPESLGDGTGGHEVTHRVAQAQPVASAEQIAQLAGYAPGVQGAWAEVVKAQ